MQAKRVGGLGIHDLSRFGRALRQNGVGIIGQTITSLSRVWQFRVMKMTRPCSERPPKSRSTMGKSGVLAR
jgi:hypothetical protein